MVALGSVFGSGCTSVLSTASLRELLAGSGDPPALETGGGEGRPSKDLSDGADNEERRLAAIEETVTRLSRLEQLDPAARATLVATLQRTDQEDWPAVVEAFAESLPPARRTGIANQEADATTVTDATQSEGAPAAAPSPPVDAAEATAEPPVHVVAKADLDAAGVAPETGSIEDGLMEEPPAQAGAVPGSEVGSGDSTVPPQDVSGEPAGGGEPSPAAEPPSPPLAIRNACFASRVQAWGVFERFTADRFGPGQEVILYFELDGLAAGESAAGHTTCIDARLRLVTDDGTLVHEWAFEPIAETCRTRRRDYFARYVVRIPGPAAAGRHRLELLVTDTLSGQQADDCLPLDILPTAAPE